MLVGHWQLLANIFLLSVYKRIAYFSLPPMFFFQCWRVVVTRLYHYKVICLYDESEQKTSTQAHLTLVEVTCHLWVILIALLYRFLTFASAPQLGTGEPEA